MIQVTNTIEIANIYGKSQSWVICELKVKRNKLKGAKRNKLDSIIKEMEAKYAA